MRLWLEVLKANMPVDPEPQQAVKMLDSEIDRLDRAVKTFPEFHQARRDALKKPICAPSCGEVVDAARPSISRAGVTSAVEMPSSFRTCCVDRQMMHQAVLNLLLNASEFTQAGGRITLGLRRNGEFAVIAVADSGKGISPEDRKKIFQLFFTTRPGGTGIGLANTFRFVQFHNGHIEFDSKSAGAPPFGIQLPLARSLEAAGGENT